jgi:hypothetical protein
MQQYEGRESNTAKDSRLHETGFSNIQPVKVERYT